MHRQFVYPIVALPLFAVAVAGATFAADPAVKAPAAVPAPVPAQNAAAATPAPAGTPAPDANDAKDASATKGAGNAEDKTDAKADAKSAKNGKKEKKPVVLAKTLFGAVKTPSPLAARAIGFYSKGCLAGGVQLSDAGPDWQTMRPSRNRAWGHPRMIKLLHRLADDAKEKDGWPGLLVGDVAQPRGGPMLSGHASHQVGLDADIWLTPMPDRVLTVKEREEMEPLMMVDTAHNAVDPKVFSEKQVALIKRAASYPEVDRIFVHPTIKKALCLAAGKDRKWLSKVRPLWGHDYHFHIRIGCTNGGCEGQKPVDGDDGCGKEVDNWLKMVAKAAPSPKPNERVVGASDMRKVTMDQLPAECKTVLNSKGPTAIAGGETPPADPATASAKK